MTAEPNLWRHTGGHPIDAAPLAHDTTADVVVIGGGFTGCSAALHLAEGGARVLLLEAQSIGHGGSGRNVGLVNAGLWTPPDEVEKLIGQEAGRRLNEVLSRGPDLVFELIDRHGIACEAARSGTLHCAHSRSGLADLERRHRQQVARGAPVKLLDAAETTRRTGSDRFLGALFDARAGTIQPLAYVRGLAHAAIAAGARLHEHSPAVAVQHSGGAWQVGTAHGTVTAAALIQATDSYAHRADQPATFTPVDYFQCATAPLSETQRRNILPGGEGCWDTARVMSSFRVDAGGRVIVGAVGSLGGLAGGIHGNWAARKLASLFPQLAHQPFEHGWSGRIGMTADHLPKVAAIGPRGVAIYGYSGRGIAPGSTFGKAAAAWALGQGDSAFPVPINPVRTEAFTRVKKYYYAFGSVVTHMIDARFG